MPSTPIPVVLAMLALRRGLKQLADLLVPPQIAMLDLGQGAQSCGPSVVELLGIELGTDLRPSCENTEYELRKITPKYAKAVAETRKVLTSSTTCYVICRVESRAHPRFRG
ncbi:hypothetical protein [Mycobacterium sp. 1274761.0]|uniref:hypothetical protein n=1 Tax=Mycobacterium sp. 1274761.0 TaxID=1834077 RepID=UPI0007FF8F4A|nr:hypothetical protein [Mycobacterium sp. 1274761.0]OBK74353.1 hypothetical protein A5651_11250 [Mycobacterium sp. 1274761.0]